MEKLITCNSIFSSHVYILQGRWKYKSDVKSRSNQFLGCARYWNDILGDSSQIRLSDTYCSGERWCIVTSPRGRKPAREPQRGKDRWFSIAVNMAINCLNLSLKWITMASRRRRTLPQSLHHPKPNRALYVYALLSLGHAEPPRA
jgi:hypothetical protein